MVLVRVGEHDADEVCPFLDEEAHVRHDQVDAGQQLFAAEGDAEVDREPGAPALRAEAVDREVHPDLAHAAERRKYQFVPGGHHARAEADNGNISPAAMRSREPSAKRRTSRPVSSRVSAMPSTSRSGSRTRTGAPRPAARLSHAVRMAAKFSPRSHSARRRAMAPIMLSARLSGVTNAPAAARSVAG